MYQLKNTPLVFLLLLAISCVSAYGQNGFSIGAGPEINIITLEDRSAALGGVVSAEGRFGPVFAAGVNLGAAYGWNNFVGVENRIFGRWYFVHTKYMEFFFQGDAGLLITLRPSDPQESRGSPSAGFTLGTRIFLPGGWYLEPYARGGYPYLGGAGILMGFTPARRGDKTGGANQETEKEPSEAEAVNARQELSSVPEFASLPIDPYVYFAPNVPGFAGLDSQIIENNYRLMREIAEFLKRDTGYQLVIEGHANPVNYSLNEEAASLNPLSVRRAEAVANSLIAYGIDRKRLIIAGSGGTKILVPWVDRAHWNLNRRVEFFLTRQDGKQRSGI